MFREARRASPQRQNNGACASDGAGLPWLLRKLRPEDSALARVCHGCRRPRSPRFASLGNLFREARRANPQRQNDGSEREGGCGRSFGRRPENCFGKPDGPAPSAKITERARATARVCHGLVAEASAVARKVVSGSPTGQLPAPKLRERARATRPLRGCRGSFGRRPESFLGKPTGLTCGARACRTKRSRCGAVRIPTFREKLYLPISCSNFSKNHFTCQLLVPTFREVLHLPTSPVNFLRVTSPANFSRQLFENYFACQLRTPTFQELLHAPWSRARFILETLNPKP